MALTKPNQELRRDLKAAASAIKDAAHDLFREAKTYAEPEFLVAMEKIGKLNEHVDRLMGMRMRWGWGDRAGEGDLSSSHNGGLNLGLVHSRKNFSTVANC